MSDKIEEELDWDVDQYFAAVYRIAKREFYKTVKPWLEENGLCFIWRPTWAVFRRKDEFTWKGIDVDDIPEEVLDVLQSEVPGFPTGDLGCFCPDYKPKGQFHGYRPTPSATGGPTT